MSKAALELMVRVYITELEKSIKAPDKIAPLFVALSSPECRLQGQWIDADEWLPGKTKV